MNNTVINKFFYICFLLIIMSSASAEVGQLNNVQLKHLKAERVPIIDIRRADEWRFSGIIEGSHLLTFFDARGNYNIDKWLTELNKIVKKNEKFILVCRSGNRTGQVSSFLDKKLGYTQVFHLQRGINAWKKAGEKVVPVK